MTQIVKRPDGYWITDLPMHTPDCGPYTKLYGDDPDECATEALAGLERFFTDELCEWFKGKPKKFRRIRLTD